MEATKDVPETVLEHGWFPPVLERRCWICHESRPLEAFRRAGADAPAAVRGVCKDCLAQAAGTRPTRRPSKNPRMQKLQLRTRAALRQNRLVPKACEHCGAAKVVAFHPSTKGRNAHLKVLWLCRKHLVTERDRRTYGRQLELVQAPPF